MNYVCLGCKQRSQYAVRTVYHAHSTLHYLLPAGEDSDVGGDADEEVQMLSIMESRKLAYAWMPHPSNVNAEATAAACLAKRPGALRDPYALADPAVALHAKKGTANYTLLPCPPSLQQRQAGTWLHPALLHKAQLKELLLLLLADNDLAGVARVAATLHRVSTTFDPLLHRATVALLRAGGNHQMTVRYFRQVS
jgi:hypothetical protein